MGRPRKPETRTRQLNLSLTTAELEGIQKRAAAVGLRPVHFGRAILLNSPELVPDTLETGVPASQRLLFNQLARLGNLLNQAVRHCHRTGAPLPPDLLPLLRDIRHILSGVQHHDS